MAQNSAKQSKTLWFLNGGVAAGLIFVAAEWSGWHPGPGGALIVLELLLLGAAVFSAVHHAEVLAHAVGEPFGSVILALAVTVIETGLILSQMSSGAPGSEFVGRDAVFATVMIVLNGIVGLGLVIGGARHREQQFSLDGATAALSVLGTLAALALILPNFTVSTPGPLYAPPQLALLAVLSLALYGIFVFVQTVRHRDYYTISYDDAPGAEPVPPAKAAVALSGVLLPLSLLVVIVVAETLSKPVADVIKGAGLPSTLLGVAISLLVLLPEGLAALRAAHNNQLQKCLNLGLGSAIATIGLTIPALAAYTLWQGSKLALGISAQNMALLVLTLFISSVTLATGRTTILQGAVHLVIFGCYLFLSAVP